MVATQGGVVPLKSAEADVAAADLACRSPGSDLEEADPGVRPNQGSATATSEPGYPVWMLPTCTTMYCFPSCM